MAKKSGPQLGKAVVYHVHQAHRIGTGSIHHPELTDFVGLVTRLHADGSADLAVFVPHRGTLWFENIKPGRGPHEFSLSLAGAHSSSQGRDEPEEGAAAETHLSAAAVAADATHNGKAAP